MTDTSSPAHALLMDSFQRIADQVVAVTDGLQPDEAVWRPDAEANSVAWLLWHLARVQDDHLAGLGAVEQAWTAQKWFERFDLPFDAQAIGYGDSSADVAQVRTTASDLAGYHADVHVLTARYLEALTTGELERVVDENWDPPVTASARIVSVLNDCLHHLGQAEYVLGMARRR